MYFITKWPKFLHVAITWLGFDFYTINFDLIRDLLF